MPSQTLAVVIPVYNEEGSIGAVLREWLDLLRRIKVDFQLQVYNDGSKDNTLKIISEYAAGNREIIVHDKPNTGHGNTLLSGYRENSGNEWILQIDSDNEISAEHFVKLWREKDNYDLLIAARIKRKSSFARRMVSCLCRLTVHIFYGKGISDINCPYRLMRGAKFRDAFWEIPDNTFAPNVIISAVACLKKYRVFELAVPHNRRMAGEVSIKSRSLIGISLKSFWQTIKFRVYLLRHADASVK